MDDAERVCGAQRVGELQPDLDHAEDPVRANGGTDHRVPAFAVLFDRHLSTP